MFHVEHFGAFLMENRAKLISEAANSIGITLSKEQERAFLRFLELLYESNKTTNIVAHSEEKEIIWRHFIDSMAIPPSLNRFFAKNRPIMLLDIGTGGGFPGVPLKLLYPAMQLSLMEATNKKIDFLRKLVEALCLDNVSVLWGRAEEFGQQEQYRGKYDVVVARALAELNTLVELALPFLKEKGIFIAYKGPRYNEELGKAGKAIQALGGEVQDIVESDITGIRRAFVVIRKISETPAKYPRRAGMPNKKPIL